MNPPGLIDGRDPATEGPTQTEPPPHGYLDASVPVNSVPATEIHRAFWLRHMRIGFSVFLAETILVMTYLLTTPGGSHRLVLVYIVSGWFGFAAGGLLVAPRLASAEWRVTFSA